MTQLPRVVVATASVCAFGAAVLIPLVQGPEGVRAWLAVPGLVAIALAVSSVAAEPRELSATLVLGAAPAMALASESAPRWLIGPVAVLLLIGAELNAWSWELTGNDPTGRDDRRRITSIARSAAVGLVASLAMSLIARATVLDGLAAVALASAALAGIGWSILPRRARPWGHAGPSLPPTPGTPPSGADVEVPATPSSSP